MNRERIKERVFKMEISGNDLFPNIMTITAKKKSKRNNKK
jgi:hypothetical protein